MCVRRNSVWSSIRVGFGATLLLVPTLGCDGYIGVEGRVYEWVGSDSASASFALVDKLDILLPPTITPVENATVLVEPWTPEDRSTYSEPELWTVTATTDACGHFKTGITCDPRRFDATISVTHDGYRSIEHVFRHDRVFHKAVVVLVRKDAQE